MFETDIKVKILLDTLVFKKKFLAQVLNITENQEMLLLSEEKTEEMVVFFNGMCKEKQILIDEILKSDNYFDKVFSEISPVFDEYADNNKDIIRFLQNSIKEVMDLDIKIRVMEQRNREFVEKNKSPRKLKILPKDYILKKYEKSQKESLK